MPAHFAYRCVAATTAALCLLAGLLFVMAFLDRALFPVLARPLVPTNHWGHYFVGFTGVVLFAWGGCLIAAARHPEHTLGVATASATGLIGNAILRLLAWYSGDFRPIGEQLRFEAGLMLVLALGFVWLRPPRSGAPDA